MPKFKKILFPVDLSKVSAEIIPYVTTLARTFQADLHVLFVARIFKYYDTIYVPPVSIVDFEEKIVAGGQRRLDEFVAEHLKDCCVSVVKVIPGDPAEEIVRYIDAEGIDLVVMSTHGRKKLDRVLFGSVANYVVTTSSAPVMTVNPYRKKK
ncbi:MAG: universal stress protein [Thermodesulfobacteriota bacterium]